MSLSILQGQIEMLRVCSSSIRERQDGLTAAGERFCRMRDVQPTLFSSHTITPTREENRKSVRSFPLEILMKWRDYTPFGILRPYHQHGSAGFRKSVSRPDTTTI